MLPCRSQNGLLKNMQFQVPQYIEVEDKIVGPLTITQFLYLASAFLFVFISYFFLTPWLWITAAVIAGSSATAFAFVKYNGRPLMAIAFAGFRYLWQPRAYAWQKDPSAARGRGFLARLGLQLDTFTAPSGGRGTMSFPFFKRAITPEEKFEILRRVSGDRETARRIDYR